jgi:hypothetical protein
VYTVPALTTESARRGVAGTRIGSLRMRLASGEHVSHPLHVAHDGVLLSGPGVPTVVASGTTVSVTGLPAGTGIATVSLTRPPKRGAPLPAVTLLADVVSAARAQRLPQRLRRGR